MDSGPRSIFEQSGCIPYRLEGERLQIALITSRRSRRWVIPKGIVDPGESPWQTAARETFEEAGLLGDVTIDPVGRFAYRKYGESRVVAVHLMHVQTQAERWPESLRRARHWMTAMEAAACVRERTLTRLILEVPRLIARPPLGTH